MPSLTLDESRARVALITVTSYDVRLDLTGDDKTFLSTTTLRFTARGPADTFLDLKPVALHSIHLNGAPLDVSTLEDGRFPLRGVDGDNELVVAAQMGYCNDGEGLHRTVDPADGRHYTYAMSFLDAAPRIFACFDQPDLKAPYTFHVLAPEDWVVVGNGRAAQVEPGVWELATTPPLSTYFVTLVAGPYHLVRTEHDGIALGLSCRASLAEDLEKDAEELFRVTGQCFDEYHRLFGIRYAFGDYHQAFVPEFNAGAMENPGCVTFRDPWVFTSKVTRAERTFRATVIAHEMAHQWFGDLVTPRWWDDLWLNESFANWMGYRVTVDVTEFGTAWVDNNFGRKRWGLEADQRASTHPVAGNGATDAVSALQDFDGISYAKGSAVLAQLNRSLGDDVFFDGVRRHLERNRFGNATMHDLFRAWEDAGARDLASFTKAWLRTASLDHVTVDRTGAVPTLVRHTPAGHPADRVHAMSVARHTGVGWVVEPVTLGGDPVPLSPEAAQQPVVLDPRDETWARLGIDPLAVEALPELLPRMDQPIMRASVWNAVRDAVDHAGLDPRAALTLVEAAVPHEDQDSAIAALSRFTLDILVARLLPDPGPSGERFHRVVSRRMESAEPGSGLQVAAARGAVASCPDPELLSRWLAGELPAGLEVDLDLRWRILVRLATLGAATPDELREHLDREKTTEAAVHHVQARASLPDAAAKAYAWEHFDGTRDVTNYEIEAAGSGLWRRGQESVTEPYVGRFFAEVAATARIRHGWVLAEAARGFFPALAVEDETVAMAQRVLDDPDLDPSLRRALVDCTDDLRRAVRVRATFG